MSNKIQWFENWFDTKFYHILYKNRDEKEAKHFLKNLVNKLQIPIESKIIDLACGKGRHSVYLNGLGLNVVGVDLSEQSIMHAKQHEKQNLHFVKADLRSLPFENEFDYGLNLFTSFAYSDSWDENLLILQEINKTLKKDGFLLIDFLNASKIILNENAKEEKVLDGIEFKISKEIKNKRIVKKIEFESEGKSYSFEEKVQLLELSDFEKLFKQSGFVLKSVFGNYNLDSFDQSSSNRLILLTQKSNA